MNSPLSTLLRILKIRSLFSWNRSKLSSSRTHRPMRMKQAKPMVKPAMLMKEYPFCLRIFLRAIFR